jgi:hypothetical protein
MTTTGGTVKPTLLFQVDSDTQSVHSYQFQNGQWTFLSHADDPGLDVLIQPSGHGVPTYRPYDADTPTGCPEALWLQFLFDIGAIREEL